MMDTPVLKAGKKTKYKHLPPTIIIFITQKDIFGRGLAKYTFEECCDEIPEMKLGDGTQKIFLNMSNKNGKPELVSLLQYMKNTTLNNPEIVVQDERIKELDRIVREIRSSEEWEAVEMSILSVGLERGEIIGKKKGEEIGKEIGKEIGQEQHLILQVCRKLAKDKTPQQIAEELEEDPVIVNQICEAASSYAPEYDTEAIYQVLHSKDERVSCLEAEVR